MPSCRIGRWEGVLSMSWNKEDLSQYNSAESPWFHISPNGKVDIGLEINPENKLGLTSDGMLKLVKAWIEKGNGLTKYDKEELIELLNKPYQGFKL